jgi:hypothetical protein
MTDDSDDVNEFLQKADAVFGEYDQGYTDADASLRQLRRHVDALREAVDDE